MVHQQADLVTVNRPNDDLTLASSQRISLNLNRGPDRLYLDDNNRVWVVCLGGALARINPATNQLEANINLFFLQPGGLAAFGKNDGQIYYQSVITPSLRFGRFHSIYSQNMTRDQLSVDPLKPLIVREVISSLHVDTNTGYLLVGTSGLGRGNSYVVRFKPDGTAVDSTAVGTRDAIALFDR
ncbi:MAG: hypothetical protein MUC97_17500 [Bernardetiaceae bacterium]|nr:hypothetical protein [Bernardetiaceae bacterium]